MMPYSEITNNKLVVNVFFIFKLMQQILAFLRAFSYKTCAAIFMHKCEKKIALVQQFAAHATIFNFHAVV